MTLEDLERAKCIAACITAAKHNLKSYDILEKASEIKIQTHNVDAEPKCIYLSGENKQVVINALREKEEKWLNEKLSELERI